MAGFILEHYMYKGVYVNIVNIFFLNLHEVI